MHSRELHEQQTNNFVWLIAVLTITPLFFNILYENLKTDHSLGNSESVSMIGTILIMIIYTGIKDHLELARAEKREQSAISRCRRVLPHQKTFQDRLEETGYSDVEIKNHRKLSFFYDPVTHVLAENPAVTNTEELVDEETASGLIKHGHCLYKGKKINNFTGAPALRNLLSELVTEAIEEKQLTFSMRKKK